MTAPTAPAPPDLDRIRSIVDAARAQGRSALLEPEALRLLEAAGIPVPRWRTVAAGASATLDDLMDLPGDRVVVRAVAPGLAHKTEVGGVAVVPREPVAVGAAMRAMTERIDGLDGFVIAEFVAHDGRPGDELLVALRWTDDFGPIVAVGAGGVAAEALASDLRPGRELAIVAPAVTPHDRPLDALRRATAPRLATESLRGQPPRLPPERLVELVERLAEIGTALSPAEILEIELNPVAVTTAGPVALDVLVVPGDGRGTGRAPRPIARIGRLLEPRTIAIVGVSQRMNLGHTILDNVIRAGFPREDLVVVKPGAEEIDGCRCVPDVASLPDRVDVFVVAVAADQAPDVVAEVIERDLAETFIVIPSGFAETEAGASRARRLRRALETARARPDGGPVLNGANCLGVRSRPGRIDTFFIPTQKLPRGDRPVPLALITGSGAFAVTRLSRLGRLEPRYVITIGNQMDLTAGDYLAHLVDDPEVRVVGVYVEGFAPLDGARFLQAARAFHESGRAVVLYRAGRTAEGARASASHTASIAGDAVVARALARQAGVAWAETPAEFDDLLRTFLLLDGRPAAGRRLGAVTNAGSECVTIADHLGPLALADLGPATRRRLEAIVGPTGIEDVVDVHHPIDLTPIGNGAIYEDVARTLLEADEVDVGLVGIVPVTDTLESLGPEVGGDEDPGAPDAVAPRLVRLFHATRKPWVAVVDAGPLYDPFVAILEDGGVPTFRTADAALRALATYCAITAPSPEG
jgi:acyl-CoA synthetase (NDP forming)